MRGAKLYSYHYVCGDHEVVAELLVDHSARVVRHLTRVKSSPLSRYAARKGGVSEEDFVNVLAVAGALHDVGKAFYQLSEHTDRKGCKYLSFLGHEWISAYFIQRLRRDATARRSPLARLLDIAFYAVLLHHHAMDVRGRARESVTRLKPPPKEEIVEGISELSKLIHDDAIREAYLETLEGVVGKVLEHARRGLADVVAAVQGEYFNLLKRSAGVRGRRVLYLLGVTALVTADYLAAGEVRGPSSSRFWGAVREFSEFYFNKPR